MGAAVAGSERVRRGRLPPACRRSARNIALCYVEPFQPDPAGSIPRVSVSVVSTSHCAIDRPTAFSLLLTAILIPVSSLRNLNQTRRCIGTIGRGSVES